MSDYREFVDKAKGFVDVIYTDIEGDDDPWPHAIIEDGDGGITMMAIDGTMLNTVEGKDNFISVIAKKLREDKARKFAWMLPVYRVKVDDGEEKPTGNFADDPRAVEFAQVIAVDAERVEMWAREIERDGGPVKLLDWNEDNDGNPELSYSGRFVDPIQEALR